MISKKSYALFDKLVQENNYKYIFDLSIIFQVSETLELVELQLNEIDFEKLCNEVKLQVLQRDLPLNYDTVQEIIDKLGLWEAK